MNFRVGLSNEATKTLSRLDRFTESRVRARLRELAENPFNPPHMQTVEAYRWQAILAGR